MVDGAAAVAPGGVAVTAGTARLGLENWWRGIPAHEGVANWDAGTRRTHVTHVAAALLPHAPLPNCRIHSGPGGSSGKSGGWRAEPRTVVDVLVLVAESPRASVTVTRKLQVTLFGAPGPRLNTTSLLAPGPLVSTSERLVVPPGAFAMVTAEPHATSVDQA